MTPPPGAANEEEERRSFAYFTEFVPFVNLIRNIEALNLKFEVSVTSWTRLVQQQCSQTARSSLMVLPDHLQAQTVTTSGSFVTVDQVIDHVLAAFHQWAFSLNPLSRRKRLSTGPRGFRPLTPGASAGPWLQPGPQSRSSPEVALQHRLRFETRPLADIC
jgi:hypothetical protein